ncbi:MULTISPECIES: hypothetical protein [unclassified Myxococcus]|uniref:hypothetical protein n=1 Tax=unclassified Myxococcus TaxID=2648731 RepID=UPI001CBCADA3|nr:MULTISPECIES: hypothetical protein [unclassified Myxococcus]MBZ4401195.1 hypothetical protein [Myxococcus sp. AS-1-15]MBZ4411004.1 hypothetical protein [Myxococcus sp. XM-1-1-1]BDT32934.1 hypothetical protein MFMH1_26030 [Myxococcus sp. MH1]
MKQRNNIMKRLLVAGAVSLFTACAGEPGDAPTQVIPSRTDNTLALLIEREGGQGGFVEGAAERFKVSASGEVFRSVSWSATSGVLEPDSERVTWKLPPKGVATLSVSVETQSGKKAQGEFHFNVESTTDTLLNTVIDPSPDVTGGFCELTFDTAGRGHIVYFNDTHRSLWYGLWDGTSWTTEQIDGAGFNNEGKFTFKPVIAVEPATGTPHIAYLKGNGEQGRGELMRVAYATRFGGTWVREVVDVAERTNAVNLSVTLNPTQGHQPVIAYGDSSSGARITARTGTNTWSTPLFLQGAMTSEALFDAAGTLYFTNRNLLTAVKGTVVETFSLNGLSSITSWSSLALTPDQHLLVLANGTPTGAWGSLFDVTLGTPLSTSTARTSQGDYNAGSNDLAYSAGKPVIAQRHGTTLELITPDARGFWTYTQLGTIQDGTRPSIAIRPTDGTPHVCFQRNGKVTFL